MEQKCQRENGILHEMVPPSLLRRKVSISRAKVVLNQTSNSRIFKLRNDTITNVLQGAFFYHVRYSALSDGRWKRIIFFVNYSPLVRIT